MLTHGLPTTSILFRIVRICCYLFKSSYLKNKKDTISFLFPFWILHQILNIFKKKKIVTAVVFPKLALVQSLVTPLTIQLRVKTSFDGEHVKRFQTLVKSSWEHFYHIFPSLWGEMIWKISPWLKFEIIRLFVNTWTAHYKYPVTDCENLSFPMQMQLSWKQKIFSRFLIPFMESPSNFEHFQKKKILIANAFPKLTTVQGLVTPLTIQRGLKTSFDSQRIRRFEIVVNSSWENVYHIFPWN